jgi:hypothetical protein
MYAFFFTETLFQHGALVQVEQESLDHFSTWL